MGLGRTLDIKVLDSPIKPGGWGNIVQKRQNGNYTLYRVYLSIYGPDLFYVKRVKYILHPTFKNQPSLIINYNPENPNFRTSIWTWGIFTVKVLIEDKWGEVHVREHKLTWDETIKSLGSNVVIQDESSWHNLM